MNNEYKYQIQQTSTEIIHEAYKTENEAQKRIKYLNRSNGYNAFKLVVLE